jgi:hypothetical protein
LTYGNFLSFFEGETLVSNDPKFPKGTSQQIMKNGLRVTIPFAKDWLLEAYGIYTNFFQSAAVSSYYTLVLKSVVTSLGPLGVNPLTWVITAWVFTPNKETHYRSGHIQFGSA